MISRRSFLVWASSLCAALYLGKAVQAKTITHLLYGKYVSHTIKNYVKLRVFDEDGIPLPMYTEHYGELCYDEYPRSNRMTCIFPSKSDCVVKFERGSMSYVCFNLKKAEYDKYQSVDVLLNGINKPDGRWMINYGC